MDIFKEASVILAKRFKQLKCHPQQMIFKVYPYSVTRGNKNKTLDELQYEPWNSYAGLKKEDGK